MKIRCKFECTKVEVDDGTHTAEFMPVYTGSKENEDFFASTPAGNLKLFVVKEQHFEVGKEY